MNKILFSAAFFLVSSLVQAAPEVEKDIQLEVFASGEAKGFNTLYKGKTYTASLNADRLLTVQPMEDGKAVGKPLVLHFGVSETEGGRGERLDLLKLDKKPKPAIQPKKIEIVGTCEDKLRFELEMGFSENAVTVQGEMRKGGGKRQHVLLGYHVRFPATHVLPESASPELIAKETDGSMLSLTGQAMPSQTAKFSQIVSSVHGVEKAVVTGSWGARKLTLEMEKSKEVKHPGTFWNYAATALYKGGWALGRAAVDKAPGGPLVLRIE
jgi:hypothetical protein